MEKGDQLIAPQTLYISELYQKQDLRQLNCSWRPVGTWQWQIRVCSHQVCSEQFVHTRVLQFGSFFKRTEDENIRPWAVVNNCNKTRFRVLLIEAWILRKTSHRPIRQYPGGWRHRSRLKMIAEMPLLVATSSSSPWGILRHSQASWDI